MLRSADWLLAVVRIALVLSLALLGACGDDEEDDPTGPGGSDTGIVIISTQTGFPDVPGSWTLTGPGDLSRTGTGSATFTGMETGEYAIVWDDIDSFETPPPRTGDLQPGRTLQLVGSYSFIAPPVKIDVTVNPEPDQLEAPWTLTLPDDSIVEGEGDSTFVDVDGGTYTVTWGTVIGWNTPAEQTQTDLTRDHEFVGAYQQLADPFGELVEIPAGSFTMGAENGDPDELPLRTVTLTHGLIMSETEVTNIEFAELMLWAVDEGYATLEGDSLFDALDGSTELLYDFGAEISQVTLTEAGYATTLPDYPIAGISWRAAAAYCDWLSLREGLTRAYDHATWECNGGDPHGAEGFRLPTEAEWEYACRAGTTTDFSSGDMPENYLPCGSPALASVGWFCGNSDGETNPVQEREPNAFGMYDMHGNLWEWCNDWYAEYDAGETVDPVGPATSDVGKVFRGGSWYSEVRDCRSANRYAYSSSIFMGFRPARTAP